jgi:hypothetical protein
MQRREGRPLLSAMRQQRQPARAGDDSGPAPPPLVRSIAAASREV